jgi:tetratricopeptide (TPR) repeat protein
MPLADPTPSTVPSGPTRLAKPVIVLALFGAVLLAYLPSIRGGSLWDDAAHITAPALQTWHGLWRIWFQVGATQQYYPVLHSAFWLEHKLWGDAVLGYHLLNIGLHATAACLFALTLARLRPETSGRSGRLGTEWLAAAVFALHPVCVESVAWISEQKNTLSLVFYLLAALAYLRFDRGRKWGWYALALGLFLLALLSKSVTATLPGILLLVLFWRRGRLSWRRDVVPLLPWFMVGAGAGLFTAWVEQNYIGARGQAYDLGLIQRCFLAGRVVWFYLGKLVWPSDLTFIYPRWQVGSDWPWSLGCLGLAATVGALWPMRRWSRAPLIALLFFIGSLFPALGFFNVYPFVFSYVADHWQYLPCLGIIALATESAAGLARRLVQRFSGVRRVVAGGVCAAVIGSGLAVLFVLTWRQCGLYRDVTTLYSDTLAKNPGCWMAHNNLGEYLSDAGSLPAAITHFEQAIRLKPDCADAHNNLGNALSKIPGRSAEAISELETALRLEPNMSQAHNNLGWVLVNTPGRLTEGIAHLQTALQLNPDYAKAHNSLGGALAQIPGRLAEAIAEYEEALRIKPDFAEAHYSLGNALVKVPGHLPEAVSHFEAALRIKPDFAEAHNNLGTALLDIPGRLPEAVSHFEAALRAKPDFAQAHNNLGIALASMPGHLPEAITHFEATLRIQPDNPEAHNNLGNALTQLGREPEAVAHYRTALRLDPDSVEAHANLGRALRNVGDGQEAIAQYREAVRLAPRSAKIWNSLGSALLRLGRPQEAMPAYEEAVRLQPDSAPFHCNFGIALTGAGRLDEAIVQLRKALQVDPGFADAHYNLAVALLQAGRAEEAAAEFTASRRAP